MLKSYYIKSNKISAKINEILLPGNHIMIEGDRFERVSKRPFGRSIVRKLQSVDGGESITCYA